MPKRDPLRPSPEKIKEGLLGVVDAVKREEKGETDALGKFLDVQEEKLKAERAERGLARPAKNDNLQTDSTENSISPREETVDEFFKRFVDPVFELSAKARKKYGDGIELKALKILGEDPTMSEDEFWKRLGEHWGSLDEETRKSIKERKIDWKGLHRP